MCGLGWIDNGGCVLCHCWLVGLLSFDLGLVLLPLGGLGGLTRSPGLVQAVVLGSRPALVRLKFKLEIETCSNLYLIFPFCDGVDDGLGFVSDLVVEPDIQTSRGGWGGGVWMSWQVWVPFSGPGGGGWGGDLARRG